MNFRTKVFNGSGISILKDGIPVEFGFVAGSEHDSLALKKLPLELPAESEIFADSAYTNYEIEDKLMETDKIFLKVYRKSNATRKDSVNAALLRNMHN
ncbi:hypothetical protein [Mucilaginibacter sp. L196]|uniref:hypothetical protein n=1 Tax=Mucilaginibacter sp. L196 TaxID=1641870 RepID=UPI001C208B5B|nr:hypothetical protein [Mucilaginibacter sp. L196]